MSLEQDKRIEHEKNKARLAEAERRLDYYKRLMDELPAAVEKLEREFGEGAIAIDEYDALLESHLKGRSLAENLMIYTDLAEQYSGIAAGLRNSIISFESEQKKIIEEQKSEDDIKNLSKESRKTQAVFILLLAIISLGLFLAVDYHTTGFVTRHLIGSINRTVNMTNTSMPIALLSIQYLLCRAWRKKKDKNEE